MSLEQAIQENTAAIRELIALQSGGKTSSAAADTAKDTKTTTSKTTKKAPVTKSKHTAEELKAVLVKFKNATSLPKAKELTKDLGYDSITDVPDDKIDEVFDAIEEAIADLANAKEPETGDDDL